MHVHVAYHPVGGGGAGVAGPGGSLLLVLGAPGGHCVLRSMVGHRARVGPVGRVYCGVPQTTA